MKSSIDILTIFWFLLFHLGSQFFWFTSSAASKILSIPAASITLVIWFGISKLSSLSPSSSSSADEISSKSFYFSFFIFPYKSMHIFRASWMPAAFSFSAFCFLLSGVEGQGKGLGWSFGLARAAGRQKEEEGDRISAAMAGVLHA